MWIRIRSDARRSALLLALALTAPHVARAQPQGTQTEDDPELVQYRERFKQGLDRLNASDVAGALSYWEPLYRDLGPQRGYRVGYNLARAYEVVGDFTRAAERYASFLDEVKRRRDGGKSLDELVLADEAKAAQRLDEITKTRGRIHVAPTTPPESVRIDQTEPRLAGFVAYVAPGEHDVVFGPGSPSEHAMHVAVRAGQLVDVALPAAPPPPPIAYRESTTHPISPGWLWGFGLATVLVGGGVTAFAYGNAIALHDRYGANPTPSQISDYDTARALAYASWGLPAALAVTTIALVVWYATGAKHSRIPTTVIGLRF